MFLLLRKTPGSISRVPAGKRSRGLRQGYADSLYPCAPSSYSMELHRIFLCFRLLSMLCTLIAPLPWPHNRAMLYRGCQQAHKPLANEVSQPAGEVGRNGCIVRIIVEANGVVSS